MVEFDRQEETKERRLLRFIALLLILYVQCCQNLIRKVRFQFLMASMKVAVFRDVAQCGLVDIDRRFRVACC
jgi:hypothetical protein